MVEDDRALAERWRDGDRDAGDVLFERHFPSVRRFFNNKVAPDDAEDLIQRTFLGCARGLSRFRGDASFRTYLFVIARNELYMYLRQRATRSGTAADVSLHSVADLRTGPSTAVARNDEHALVLRALQCLPVQLQTLLELSYWEGMSAAELAPVFEVTTTTIRTRKLRARAMLRAQIERLAAGR